MALIRTINRVGAAGYGVNILEETPAAPVTPAGTDIVAVVGLFPWGPTATPTSVSGGGLFETFSPLEFAAENEYPSLRAFIGKNFPATVTLVRTAVTGAAAATVTFDDALAVDSVTVTARYTGAVGNRIAITWAANAGTPANSDMTVRIIVNGVTRYEAAYENVVVDNTGSITVNDPDDPFVTVVAAGGATDVPAAVTDTSLASGADGTVVVGDLVAALNTLADSSVNWDVGFGAEIPDSLVATWNAAVLTFQNTNSRGFFIASTPASQAVAAAITAVSSIRSDYILRPWRKVRITNTFDSARGTITVDGNSFIAVATASTAPEQSPGGANSALALRAITGVETGVTATDAELEQLRAAGLSPIVIAPEFEGAIIRGAVTTSIASEDARKVFRRRMVDFLAESISAVLVRYAERPLDVDITNRRLGPVTRPEIASIKEFLEDLQDPGTADGQRIRGFELDPFGSNVAANINAGQWIILLRVQLLSMQEELVLRLQAGTSVSIDEVS